MISTRSLAFAAVTTSALVVGNFTQRRLSPAATSMFRGGPAHHGVYEGGGPSLVGLAWRAPTDGDVISSPAIANGTVYIGSGDGGLYALDLATGARRWRCEAGSPVVPHRQLVPGSSLQPAATGASSPSTRQLEPAVGA